MLYISIDKIKDGMIAAKDIVSRNNMMLLSAGKVLDRKYVDWFYQMGVEQICIEGDAKPKDKKIELEKLDERFKHVIDKPHMEFLKRIVKEHIENL